jgi:hypothetical protein
VDETIGGDMEKLSAVIFECALCGNHYSKKAVGSVVEVPRILCCNDKNEMMIKKYEEVKKKKESKEIKKKIKK